MDSNNKYCEITPEIYQLTELCRQNDRIDPALYTEYDVKRGLRDANGRGVLCGLTEIGEIQSYVLEGDKTIPCEGKLFYRGLDVEDVVRGFLKEERFGFEEVTYLLLFGELPAPAELNNFRDMLSRYRTLPTNFVRDVIMKASSKDMMNTLARSILTLYAYDDNASDISIPNVLRQSLQLIANFPLLAVYAYQAYAYYHDGQSFFIHAPRPELSTAENILHLLRADSQYTKLEARILDLALVLHAEHGGGNNSTFTTHVVTSTHTDTYSTIAASLAALKGPRHGGANIKVVQMFEDLKLHVQDWGDENAIRRYVQALLNKKAFDRSGLIYGLGHAVYSISDPRAKLFEDFVRRLAAEKGLEEEYRLYSSVARLAMEEIQSSRKMHKGVSPNIDFYSGFVYRMLGLPLELYTPIFAVARVSGWSAHRIEELINDGKIIRPAYNSVAVRKEYLPLDQR